MYNSRGVYFQNGIPTEHAVIINRTFARVNIPKWINANYMYIFC